MHMHCIVSGGGLTPNRKIRKTKSSFFIPAGVLRDKFKGKYLSGLDSLYKNGPLTFPAPAKSCGILIYGPNSAMPFMKRTGVPTYIKETFNGFGNAIEYLGRYTHKIAISNSRILSVDEQRVTFSAKGKKRRTAQDTHLENAEFIRRYLMHVLLSGFQKIRYYGFLNNRGKTKNLKLIFALQGHQRFRARYINLSIAELIKAVWEIDIRICPECGCCRMQNIGRTYGTSYFYKASIQLENYSCLIGHNILQN